MHTIDDPIAYLRRKYAPTARLDSDGTAKGRTSIVGRVAPGALHGPGVPLANLQLRDNETGRSIVLAPVVE